MCVCVWGGGGGGGGGGGLGLGEGRKGGEEKEEGRKREGRRTGACTNVWVHSTAVSLHPDAALSG